MILRYLLKIISQLIKIYFNVILTLYRDVFYLEIYAELIIKMTPKWSLQNYSPIHAHNFRKHHLFLLKIW